MPENSEKNAVNSKKIRKMTKVRLTNIALYYLERFDSSVANLQQVLNRRIYDYARQVDEFDTDEAENWIDEIIEKFLQLGYLNDSRYAEFKIQNYVRAGKTERYIRQKMLSKGICEQTLDEILQQQNIDEYELAKSFVCKKKIGPYRSDEETRRKNRQKDLGTLIRAGFSYGVAQKIIGVENIDDFT